MQRYLVVMEPTATGYSAYSPDLPGCVATGASRADVEQAMREAERCFNCGLCNQCDNCHLFCPDLSIIHDQSAQGRHINYDYCKGCGLCVVECPRNAMTLEEEIR